MDDNEFNIELAHLLKSEAEKEPNYTQSIEQERAAVVAAFYEEYTVLTVRDDFVTVEDFLACASTPKTEVSEELEDGQKSEFIIALQEATQKAIELYPELASGKVKVSGEGIFFHIPKPEDMASADDDGEPEILSDGATLTGEIKYYSVDTFISHDDFMRVQRSNEEELLLMGEVNRVPGILLRISDATVTEPDSVTQKSVGDVVVPFNYPTLTFEKIISRGSLAPKTAERPAEVVEVTVHFKGEIISETYTNIENDLNYNDYSSEEERSRREEYQVELELFMSGVERNKPMALDAFNVIMINGDEMQLEQQRVFYLDPSIMKINDAWRVVHVFHVETDKGTRIAHVLPEHLLKMNYINEN